MTALLQIEAAEREEIFKGHLVYLEQRRERELERERERERELERDRELDAEDGAEKKVRSCGLVVMQEIDLSRHTMSCRNQNKSRPGVSKPRQESRLWQGCRVLVAIPWASCNI